MACKGFICIEIPTHLLTDSDFDFLSRISYTPQKHLSLNTIDGFEFQKFRSLFGGAFNSGEMLQLLKAKIEKKILHLSGALEVQNKNYISLAKKFEHLLFTQDVFTVAHTVAPAYIDQLPCEERTLRRACRNVFGLGTQDVLKQRLVMSILPLLVKQKYSLEQLACKLGYSSLSAFTKFVRTQTGTTPGKIMKQFLENDKGEKMHEG